MGPGPDKSVKKKSMDTLGGEETRCFMNLTPQDLEKISSLTLEHYNRNAGDFHEGTHDHDVGQNIAALLQYIEGEAPFTILDFGCGPGRDLQVFAGLGHITVGLDGAARFADMARAHGSGEVWQQDFLKLDLPDRHFDGVFANAALFHVPSQELPRVLRELHATLKPRGVLFSSNPHGHNEEGWNRGRYGAFHDLETWRRYLSAAGFDELAHYYRPAGVPRAQQPWLASVWRRIQRD
jgi:SAM-dependent methyltransferase